MPRLQRLITKDDGTHKITPWKIPEIFVRVERLLTHGGLRATALQELKHAEAGEPFKILIGTILSHRTRDENTRIAVEKLFSAYHDVYELSKADPEKVKHLIRPAGFYRVKANRIVEVARILVGKYGGRVPDTLEQLLELPSVGRKTANCVLVYAFGKPAIPVDTHVHRISNRLGLVQTKTPEETEQELVKLVDRKYWFSLNELFVRFGQNICRPVAPLCHKCTLTERCPEYFRRMASARPR